MKVNETIQAKQPVKYNNTSNIYLFLFSVTLAVRRSQRVLPPRLPAPASSFWIHKRAKSHWAELQLSQRLWNEARGARLSLPFWEVCFTRGRDPHPPLMSWFLEAGRTPSRSQIICQASDTGSDARASDVQAHAGSDGCGAWDLATARHRWLLCPGVPDVKCQEPVPTRAFPFRRMSGTGLHFTLGMSLNLSSGPLGVCSGAPIYRAALALEI